MQSFARRVLAKKMKTDDMKCKVFGDLSSDCPEEFEFKPGHKAILLEIGQKLNSVSKPIGSQPLIKTSHKPLQSLQDEEQDTEWTSKQLESEQLRLLVVIEKGLRKEFKIEKESSQQPLCLVSIKSSRKGSITCLIGDCKHHISAKTISRTSKRPWSTQNFYRHVRTIHVEKESGPSGAKQLKLLDMNVTVQSQLQEQSVDDVDDDSGSKG